MFSLYSIYRAKISQRIQGTHQTERKSTREKERVHCREEIARVSKASKLIRPSEEKKRKGERQGRERRKSIDLQNNTLQMRASVDCLRNDLYKTSGVYVLTQLLE